MSKKEDADKAREYLAEVASSGQTDWQPSKPLDEYKDDQVIRKAREFHRMEAANLPISNQVARGHGNRERDKTPELPTSKQNYDIARRAERAGLEPSAVKSGDRYNPEFEGDETASERAIDFLASQVPGSRVSIGYQDAEGNWHNIFGKGVNVDTVKNGIDQAGSFEDWLDQQAKLVYGSNEDVMPYFDGDEEYKIVVLSRAR